MPRPSPLLMALISALASGCQPAEPPPPRLVPVQGKVTLDGKPLAGASIGFLPRPGSAGGSDVRPDGSYEVTTMGFKESRGEYTVQISYKMGTDGKPQSLGQQFSLVQPESMIGAKELLPKKYSDFGASELRATIPPEGALDLNFDIKGPLAEPPPISKKFLEAQDKARRRASPSRRRLRQPRPKTRPTKGKPRRTSPSPGRNPKPKMNPSPERLLTSKAARARHFRRREASRPAGPMPGRPLPRGAKPS